MAPKRRSSSKVVKTKTRVVEETVEVTTVADDDGPPEQPADAMAVDVSAGSTAVVHVEVSTPTSGSGAADDYVKHAAPATPADGVGQRQETQDVNEQEDDDDASKMTKQQQQRQDEEQQQPEALPPPPADGVGQSQETQAPNEQEEEEEGDASKTTKQEQRQDEAEKQSETPRVASERKPAKQQQEAKKGRRRRRRRLSSVGDVACAGGFKRYVWRVLKQVHPELGVSGHAMQVLDMMMADMFERLADEAARLSKATGKATLGSREVQSAVRLVLPGDLANHAVSEATKAIANYMSYGH